jgi:hypothetical protein
MEAYKKAGNRKDAPPKHEMVHFPGLMSEKREFGDFRTVLHTGLYSQIVAMEVPVGGDIGDEVNDFPVFPFVFSSQHLLTLLRSIPLTKSCSSHLVAALRLLLERIRKSRLVMSSLYLLVRNTSL